MTEQTVIDEAQNWLGFQARANNQTPFGDMTGYNGITWAGAFVDYVFFKTGTVIPSCVYSPSGLAEFIRMRRISSRPRQGDVVFFNFSVTGENFGMPHVGIVKETSAWDRDGVVKTIEGNTTSGLPKGDQTLTGVFERVRSRHEVLVFGRPRFRPGRARKNQTGSLPVVSVETVRPGRRNKGIGAVQASLRDTVGLGRVTIDMFDTETQRAYSRWQRTIGYVGTDASGIPDPRSLQVLADRTGRFKLGGIPTS